MVHDLFDGILISLGSFYVAGLIALFIGLFRSRHEPSDERPFVSVVVAARDEEHHIGTCLDSLCHQTYLDYEIIVIDDRSRDRTGSVVKDWMNRSTLITLLSVNDTSSKLVGKKQALDLGIRHSRGEIILTTDADCRPPRSWIEGMVSCFRPKVGLVAGYTYTELPGESAPRFQRLRSLERIAIAAVSAGSIGLGKGLTCTGQNLAYRKTVFEQVGGFFTIGHLRSGDDDLFIQLVGRKTDWEMHYVFNRETSVRTIPPSDYGSVWQQEKRRSSKGPVYPWWLGVFLVLTFLFFLLIVIEVVLVCVGYRDGALPAVILGVKALMECSIIIRICSMLGRSDLLPYFPLMELIHIPYYLVFALMGTFGSYRWKDTSPAQGS